MTFEIDLKSMGYEYSHRELKEAFEKVQDKHNWKNPINCICDKKDIDILKVAIPFFTGSNPSFERINSDTYRVSAKGYYLSVGA